MQVTYADARFRPNERIDGYLPLEDHGLIGDGETTALVARDGSIPWLCVPRFDDPPLFCAILDHRRGGSLTLTVEGLVEARQRYELDSGVLVTELRGPEGVVRITDALTLHAGADLAEGVSVARNELLRSVRVLSGQVALLIDVEPRGGGEAERRGPGWRVRCTDRPELDLQLWASAPLQGLHSRVELRSGDGLDVTLAWRRGGHHHRPVQTAEVLAGTLGAWRRWMGCFAYDGPHEALVRRSAVTLKLLDHWAGGAMVAAPTSSLPEAVGGSRNWDYRYAWVRDAAFSVHALRRIGMTSEVQAFLGWVLDAIDHGERPRVLYDLDARNPDPEREDHGLEGWRRSSPVRWGNGAADQRQHDVFGEVLDCAHQWVSVGGALGHSLWPRLRTLVEAAASEWHEPDHGIWEVRTTARPFTYSAAMCQVALERGARMAENLGLPGDPDRWRKEAQRVTDAVLDEAWDPKLRSLTEHLGGGGLDASLLALPLRQVVPAQHTKMLATVEAVGRTLGVGEGLLYRYLPEESPDGLPGHEGAFLLCSFWMVDNLALQGRTEEAEALFESLCARAGVLGLLPEQIDPSSGAFLGNYPQAFSHVGLISSGVNLTSALRGER